MPDYPTLNKNPIIQAIIEIKFELPQGFKLSSIKELANTIKEKYPKTKEHFQNQIKIQDGKTNLKAQLIGYNFFDGINDKSIQISATHFDFFKGYPYGTWEIFKEECLLAWRAFNQIVTPSRINQVSTRFINKIELTDNPIKVEEYFNTYMNISDNLNNDIAQFYIKYSNIDKENKLMSHISLSTEDNGKEGVIPLVFDIDVLTLRQPEDLDIESALTKLHDKKNEIFFNTITDKTLNLLK